MTKVQKLVERLRREGWTIPDDYEFRRCRPGHWGRSAGAFSWTMTNMAGLSIGSPDSVSQLLKSKVLADGPDGAIYGD